MREGARVSRSERDNSSEELLAALRRRAGALHRGKEGRADGGLTSRRVSLRRVARAGPWPAAMDDEEG